MTHRSDRLLPPGLRDRPDHRRHQRHRQGHRRPTCRPRRPRHRSGRDKARGDAVVAGIRAAGGNADFVAADLSDERQRARRSPAGPSSSAAATSTSWSIMPASSPSARPQNASDEIDEVFAVNVKAPFFLVAALAPADGRTRQGRDRQRHDHGRGLRHGGMALYGSSKAALDPADQSLGGRVRPAGVRVNAVSPGPTRTEGTVRWATHSTSSPRRPGRPPGRPEEIAAAISVPGHRPGQLRSRRGLPVDGGRLAA